MSHAPAELAGLVDPNEQNGFCVLRLTMKAERELVTLIGQPPTEPAPIQDRVRKPKS